MNKVIPSVVVAFGVLLCSACCLPIGESKKSETKQDTKAMYRPDLENQFIGKTKQDLKDAFGNPNHTNFVADDEYWSYKGVSIDPNNQKADSDTTFWLDKSGKVIRISY